MRFILHVTVWGNRHTNLFVDYALPSLLGDNSIDINNKKYQFQFNIFCSSKDFAFIKNHKIFKILKSKIEVKVNTRLVDENLKVINQLNNIKDVGGSLNQGHVRINNICIKKSMDEMLANRTTAFCWFKPDSIYSNTYITKIVDSYEKGKRMIWAPSENRSCVDILDYVNNFKNNDGIISIDSTSLSTASFKYIVQRYGYKNFYNYYNPSRDWGFYHTTPDGVIKHAPSPNLIFLYPTNYNVSFQYNNDETFNDWTATDFLEKTVPNLNDIDIVKDTNEITSLDIEYEKYNKKNFENFNKITNNIFFRPSKIKFIKLILKENLSKHCNYYYSTPILHRIDNTDKLFKVSPDRGENLPSKFIQDVIKFAEKIKDNKPYVICFFSLAKIIHILHRLKRKFTPSIRITGGDH